MTARADGHVAFECGCGATGCCYCDGGLFSCTRCGSAEGATTTQCPGVRLTGEQIDDVYAGRLDFKDGDWLRTGPCVMCAHWAPLIDGECPDCRH